MQDDMPKPLFHELSPRFTESQTESRTLRPQNIILPTPI